MRGAVPGGAGARRWSGYPSRLIQLAKSEMGGFASKNGMELSASAIINAAGTGAPALTNGLTVKKRKGHLTITDPCPGFIRHQLVELGYLKSAHSIPGDSVAFNVQPRSNGQVVIGSSRQYDVEGEQVDEIILDRMRNVPPSTCRTCRNCRLSECGPDFALPRRTTCRSSARGPAMPRYFWLPGTKGWELPLRLLRRESWLTRLRAGNQPYRSNPICRRA